LNDNIRILEEKIRIMALLELIFGLPKNDRNVTFNAISKITGLSHEQVEPLVMRAMSLGLIKGGIDEVRLIRGC
jgi:26S proteasome regulatory subunit N9